MSIVTLDLSAATTLNVVLRAGTGAALIVTVTQGGEAVDLTGAEIKYQAALQTPIVKEVGNGITVTDALGGVFRLVYDAEDTAEQNRAQTVPHECKILLLNGAPAMLWEGAFELERSLFTTM